MEFTQKDMGILYETGKIPKTATRAEVESFVRICEQYGLNPFAGEVVMTSYLDKKTGAYASTSIVTLNALRRLNSADFAGMKDAIFDLRGDGSYKTAADFKEGEMPISCTVSVCKMVSGVICEIKHTCLYREFAGTGPKWRTMPFQMLAKCAEAHARRKGWGLSGIFIEEELDSIKDENNPAAQPAAPVAPAKTVFDETHPSWLKGIERVKSGGATLERAIEQMSITCIFPAEKIALFTKLCQANA